MELDCALFVEGRNMMVESINEAPKTSRWSLSPSESQAEKKKLAQKFPGSFIHSQITT